MARTKSSSEIYFLDVPEVKEMSVEFVYNFFSKDEGLNENFIDSTKFPMFERNFEGYVTSIDDKVPRFNIIRFKPVYLHDKVKNTKEINTKIRGEIFLNVEKDLIKNNLEKIISEDHFSVDKFSTLQFKGRAISEIAYNMTSGSITQFMYNKHYRQGISTLQKSRAFASSFDQTIDPSFVMSSMAESDNFNGVKRFHVHEGNMSREGDRLTQFDSVKDVYVHGQVNNKVFDDFVQSMMVDPYVPSLIGLRSLQIDAKNKKTELTSAFDLSKSTNLPFIKVSTSTSVLNDNNSSVDLVGYVVDKVEILKESVVIKDQIIIEGKQFGSIIDFNVKYGSTYMYAIRAIYQIVIPAYDESLDRVAMATILVSSRPSESKYVVCVETIPPKSPADFTFHWDNENDRILLSWSFPLNKQRDIKKFQVFRRSSINDPYELLKQYDFNDSLTPLKSIENPYNSLVEKGSTPKTIYFDDEFNKDSKYIYAVASIDAHELTSGYSDQFEVWFDKRHNKLKKRLISHSGAPKQYPNLYLEKDLFIDSIKTEKKDTLSVYFTPDYYNYFDNSGNEFQSFISNDYGGSYKLNVINLDNQKSETITININDRRQKFSIVEYPPPPFTTIAPSTNKSQTLFRKKK